MNCPECGGPIKKSWKTCYACGAKLNREIPQYIKQVKKKDVGKVPEVISKPRPKDDKKIEGVIADYNSRIAAIIIDFAIISLLMMAINLDTFKGLNLSIGFHAIPRIFHGFSKTQLLIAWVYFAWMESSNFHGTIGKRIMKITIVDKNKKPLTFGKASARFFMFYFSNIFMFIGSIITYLNKEKRSLHDKWSDTYVLKVTDR